MFSAVVGWAVGKMNRTQMKTVNWRKRRERESIWLNVDYIERHTRKLARLTGQDQRPNENGPRSGRLPDTRLSVHSVAMVNRMTYEV